MFNHHNTKPKDTTTDVLRFITAGSVDDGKSTLIGRLLIDTHGVLVDQLDAINRSKYRRTTDDAPDLALLTDGLEAEREQGITIDVAYRYFATPSRKFIVADAPGHEQYTRNMMTGASTAQAIIILIDATKVHDGQLLTQTRRHSTLAHLLGIQHVIVAINKMDLVQWDQTVFEAIHQAYSELAQQIGIEQFHALPVSALSGDNISTPSNKTPWYQGPHLLELLENLPVTPNATTTGSALFVQWVIRHNGQSDQAFRGYAGQLHSGSLQVGDQIQVWPSTSTATIRALYNASEPVSTVYAGQAITVVLDREIDISRGDLIHLAHDKVNLSRDLTADICWLDQSAFNPARHYWLKQGTKITQAKITTIHHVRDIESLAPVEAKSELVMNDIAAVSLQTREALVTTSYKDQPATGAFILIDPTTHQTVAAGMMQISVSGIKAHY